MRDFSITGPGRLDIIDRATETRDLISALWMAAHKLQEPECTGITVLAALIEDRMDEHVAHLQRAAGADVETS